MRIASPAKPKLIKTNVKTKTGNKVSITIPKLGKDPLHPGCIFGFPLRFS
jgi:hypothetical protein